MGKMIEIKDFNSLIDLITYFDSEEKCAKYLAQMKWGGNPTCPHCDHNHLYELKGKNKRYKCAKCRKQFSVRVGTIFEDSKISLQKWFVAIYLIINHKKGISSLQLHRDLNVTQKTAWFMLQRIRYALDYDFTDSMSKEVEIDETFVGGKNKNRHADKKVKFTQGRSVKDKSVVLGMVQRKGHLSAKVLPDTTAKSIAPQVLNTVVKGTSIYTDEFRAYKTLDRVYDHKYVKHYEGQYVVNQVHTNTIEGFWSLLKRSVIGIYHFTSKKHLQKYVDESVFRYNTKSMNENYRFQLFLTGVHGRLTYTSLTKG